MVLLKQPSVRMSWRGFEHDRLKIYSFADRKTFKTYKKNSADNPALFFYLFFDEFQTGYIFLIFKLNKVNSFSKMTNICRIFRGSARSCFLT